MAEDSEEVQEEHRNLDKEEDLESRVVVVVTGVVVADESREKVVIGLKPTEQQKQKCFQLQDSIDISVSKYRLNVIFCYD